MTGAGSAAPESITVVQDAQGRALTKSFSWRGGKLVKGTYPNAAEFRAYVFEVHPWTPPALQGLCWGFGVAVLAAAIHAAFGCGAHGRWP